MLWLIIPTLVIFWIISGAYLATLFTRKADNACKRNNHSLCDHSFWAMALGAVWPIGIPVALVGLSVAGLVTFGIQAGSTPLQRKENRQARIDAIKQFKQGQIDAANAELEKQLYGKQECKHCRVEVTRRNGVWIAPDGGNACYANHSDYGGAHQVPDAIDAKLKAAQAERDAS